MPLPKSAINFTLRLTLVIAILPLFFLPHLNHDFGLQSVDEFWNTGHVFFFLIVASLAAPLVTAAASLAPRGADWRIIFSYAWQRTLAPKKQVPALWVWLIILAGTLLLGGALAGTLLLGGAIELIQGAQEFFGANRAASYGDLLRNMAGAFMYLLWWQSRRTKRFRLRLRFLILPIAILVVLPVILAAFDDYNVRKDFPILASFEHKDELSRWVYGRTSTIRRVEGMARDGQFAAAIDYTTDQYSQITMKYFYRDWRGYKAMALDVYNPNEPVELMIKIYDRQHEGPGINFLNRYNASRHLQHGWNEIRLPMEDIEHGPANRLMELDQMRGVAFFLTDQPKPRTLFIDNLRLVP